MLVVQLSGLCASLWEMTQDYQRIKKMIYKHSDPPSSCHSLKETPRGVHVSYISSWMGGTVVLPCTDL